MRGIWKKPDGWSIALVLLARLSYHEAAEGEATKGARSCGQGWSDAQRKEHDRFGSGA